MTHAAAALRAEALGRLLPATLLLAAVPAAAFLAVGLEVEPEALAALGGLAGALALALWRPAWGILLTLGLFSDVLYFGTFGFAIPLGQLVVTDVLLLVWWGLALAAALRSGRRLVRWSPPAICLVVLHPALLLFYYAYTAQSFGATAQEMLRASRPFLHLSLFVPLAFWLRRPGGLDRLWRAAVVIVLAASAIQFTVYAAGIDVTPYGLFYEWQVWRASFAGFDRSHQPFFGLNLILIGGFISMSLRDASAARRQGWAAGAAALLVSALITFGRGYWAAVLMSSLVATGAEARARGARPLWRGATVAAAVAVALVAVSAAAGLELSGLLRAVGARGEGGADSLRYLEGTFGDRYDSINRFLIREHPLLGVGFFLALGSAADLDFAGTGHSLYADLLLRLGAAGAVAAATLLAVFLLRCRAALARDLTSAERALVIGCLGASLGNLLWGLSSSHMLGSRGMAEMALMIAVVEAAALRAGRSPVPRGVSA